MGVPDVDSTDAEAAASLSQDATETTTRTAGMAKYLKLYAVPEVEEAHGVAGRIVKRLGIFAYSLFFVIPLIFVAIIFAIVPIGDPLSKTMRQQWVFLFISNPAVMALFTFLYEATFLSVAERERPFRVSLIPMVLVIVLQMGLLVPLLLLNGVIDYLGILLLAIFFFALYIGCFIAYPLLRSKLSTFFRSFILLISLYLPILSAYIIGYREVGSSGGQAGLAIGLAFVTFVYRRIMLSRLDPFPLDLAQLLAGFWVQNLSDIVQIFSFPQVNSPKVFAAIWAANSFGNIGFLGFISDAWIFTIRPTLKNAVLNGIKCNFPLPPKPEMDYSFQPEDRGHGANVGGYRRRQFRFFFFRLMSQAIAMLLYISISPMLRFGLNDDRTPLSLISSSEYRNSLIYAGANLVFIAVVMLMGYHMLHEKHHQTFHEIREIHKHDLQNHTRVGLIIAIITHNLVLSIGIILQPYCVFFAFRDCELRL